MSTLAITVASFVSTPVRSLYDFKIDRSYADTVCNDDKSCFNHLHDCTCKTSRVEPKEKMNNFSKKVF